MNDFLRELERGLQEHLKENYLPPHRAKTPGWNYHDLQFFSKGADLLSTALTEGRSDLPKNYLNRREYRSAYLLYFTLINAAKVWHTLKQAVPFLRRGSLQILDLGCGPGTAALAASFCFPDRPVTILGVEQNKEIRKDAKALWQRLVKNPRHRFTLNPSVLSPESIKKVMRGNRFDIVIAANFLSELLFAKQVRLAQTILQSSSLLIVIEPALQKTTRQLMHLRDLLVANRRGFVLAPCLHQRNCPMLSLNNRDWCHFYIDWQCPRLIRDVDRLIGNKHDYLKMAYMIFGSQLKTIPNRAKPHWRVVSSPLVSTGKKEFLLCGENGFLLKLGRLEKHKAAGNLAFDKMKRGDIVSTENKSRLGPEDSITIIPFSCSGHPRRQGG